MNRPRGRPFENGNRMGRGRPKGSRNKRNTEAQEMLAQYAVPVMSKCIGKALEGDNRALALCVERIVPVDRDCGIKVKLPKLPEAPELSDIDRAEAALINKIATGKVNPSDGQKLHAILQAHRINIQNRQIEARLSALEKLAPEQAR